MTSAELEAVFPSMVKEMLEFFGAALNGDPRPKRRPEDLLTLKLQRNRCFLEITARYEPFGIELPARSSIAQVGNKASTLIHLPGLRGNPERTYPVT
jgi:hypothetical protein